MKSVKVRLLNDGGYPFKAEHNRTFPVIVNGYIGDGYHGLVQVCYDDCKAIGMYPTEGKDYPFYPGTEAEIVKRVAISFVLYQ
ncbi:hypothetical protein VC1_51 [Vibrio phage Vc1]|uniref:Uncharacterized protein n=1 Tax=Vibrio phage Vc1 TaxID=1480731 RepID=A0A9X9TDD5_9CAUD|nr:hypothetical protein KMB90_gp51 [Vibrio virus 2019VC1]